MLNALKGLYNVYGNALHMFRRIWLLCICKRLMMEERKGGWLLRKEEGEKGLKEEMVFVLPIWLCFDKCYYE